MCKEQRVFKNNGKRFEEDFKASFSKHIWTYRPPDTGGGMVARFTQESICDLMAYNTETKSFTLFELKSTLGTSVSFKPYQLCKQYEDKKKVFDEWIAKQTSQTKKELKEEIKDKKREIKELYKETNQAMIKYHQILSLLSSQKDHKINSYITFTFFTTSNTYALSIENFVDHFWKITTKKSINEKDLEKLTKEGLAQKIEQSYIRRTMKSKYEVDFLTEN